MKESSKRIIQEIISALIVLLFVYAALTKLIDLQKFQVELGKSPILNPFNRVVSLSIPLLEICISCLFFFKVTRQLAFYLSFGLMVAFTAYIITILRFSNYIPCSCGGVIQNMTWTQHIYFNLAFIILGAIGVLIYPVKTLSADKGVNRKPSTE